MRTTLLLVAWISACSPTVRELPASLEDVERSSTRAVWRPERNPASEPKAILH